MGNYSNSNFYSSVPTRNNYNNSHTRSNYNNSHTRINYSNSNFYSSVPTRNNYNSHTRSNYYNYYNLVRLESMWSCSRLYSPVGVANHFYDSMPLSCFRMQCHGPHVLPLLRIWRF